MKKPHLLSSLLTPRYALGLMILFQVLVHLPKIDEPFQGMHSWRKAVGHAAAVNYYEEDNRFFFPRADIRTHPDDTGAVYHELPTTYWLTAQSYSVFGKNYVTPRVIAMCFNLGLILAIYFLGLALGYPPRRSLIFTFVATLSPIYIYYVDSFVPNVLGLTFFLGGLALFIPSTEKESFSTQWFLGIILTTFATLSKPEFLFYGLVVAFVLIRTWIQSYHRWKVAVHAAIGGVLVLVPNFMVLQHAEALHAVSPHLRAIHTPIGPALPPTGLAEIWENVSAAMTKWLVEMNIGYGALIFFLIGIRLVGARPFKVKGLESGFWISWLVAFLIFCGFFVTRLKDHDYYIFATLPVVAAISTAGAWHLLNTPKWRTLAIALLILLPVFGVGRVYNRWFRNTVLPPELLQGRGERISRDIPKKDLVIMSGDPTPIAFLFHINRKGITWKTSDPPTLVGVDLRHFKWVVHYRKAGALNESLLKYCRLKKKDVTGDFEVFAARCGNQPVASHGENPG